MNNSTASWQRFDSKADLLASLPATACTLVAAEQAQEWGSFTYQNGCVVPLGYSNLGLKPQSIEVGNRALIGINELLICIDTESCRPIFKYCMPSIFHKFVCIEQNRVIVQDEIGFISLAPDGKEQWQFLMDLIEDYRIEDETIIGRTLDGVPFRIPIK